MANAMRGEPAVARVTAIGGILLALCAGARAQQPDPAASAPPGVTGGRSVSFSASSLSDSPSVANPQSPMSTGDFSPRYSDSPGGSAERGEEAFGNESKSPWSVTLGVVYLSRTEGSSGALEEDAGSGRVGLQASALGSGSAYGPYLSAAYAGDEWGCNLTYFSCDGWSNSWSHNHPGDIAAPFLAPGQVVDQVDVSSSGRLYSGEVNITRRLTERFYGLAGIRWAELDEQGSGDAFSTTFTSGFNLNATNDLVGLQLGAGGHLVGEDTSTFRIDGFLKAGLFNNQVHDAVTNTGGGAVPIPSDDSRVAFLGEAELAVGWRVMRRIEIFASAEALWLSGVAVAPDLMVGGNNTTAFFTGAVGGVRVVF